MKPFALAALLALAGCSTQYVQPGKSAADFQSDLYACERDAAPAAEPLYRSRMLDRCLTVKGWQPK